MPRIPYVYPAAGESEGCACSVLPWVGDRMRAHRGEQCLLLTDGILLNTPEVARGYNELDGAIKGKTEIADTLKELLETSGTPRPRRRPTLAQIFTISITSPTMSAAASRRDFFPPYLATALDFCDASSTHVKVLQNVFDSLRLKEHLSVKEVVEMTLIVVVFQLILRFLQLITAF
ncbi:hypothetical protein B0H14DRAFT_2630406 [Mycena olivaceomarginata]|nr:hypothetical protein B0H14DRAFT_2630406 [Mycena olivaceomarginata]